MRHYYTIEGYDGIDNTYFLRGDDGLHFVDLEDLCVTEPETLTGKRISVSHLMPAIEIAIDPQIEN
jgi:hypothetical protein